MRKHRRVSAKFTVDYRDVNRFFTSFASNISEGGIFINLIDKTQVQPVGTKVELTFLMPNTKKKIKTVGTVRWVNLDSSKGIECVGMGVQFQDLSDNDREVIKEVVEGLS